MPRINGERVRRAFRRYYPYARNILRRAAPIIGDIALQSAVNYFTRVPDLKGDPRTMTRPFPKRRRFDGNSVKGFQDSSGYVQLTNLGRYNVGRALVRQERLNRALEAQLLSRIDRFQNMSKVGDDYGAYGLSFYNNVAQAVHYLPYYLFDLTSLYQQHYPGTNPSYGVPFIRLVRYNGSTQQYDWTQINGIKADGTTTSNEWDYERTPYTPGNNEINPYEKAFLEWADIRLSFWGATAYPTTATVQLVRFTDKIRQPAGYYKIGALTPNTFDVPSSGSEEFVEYQKFWTTQVDNLITNNMQVRGQAADAEGVEVIWSKQINMNPTATYENDPTGHQFQMKIFYDMDMLCDYRNAYITGTTGDGSTLTSFDNPNYWVRDDASKEVSPVLRNLDSRVFLLIKGMTPKKNADSTAFDASANASFDLMVRRKHVII